MKNLKNKYGSSISELFEDLHSESNLRLNRKEKFKMKNNKIQPYTPAPISPGWVDLIEVRSPDAADACCIFGFSVAQQIISFDATKRNIRIFKKQIYIKNEKNSSKQLNKMKNILAANGFIISRKCMLQVRKINIIQSLHLSVHLFSIVRTLDFQKII